jgi:subtilisin family serine protease
MDLVSKLHSSKVEVVMNKLSKLSLSLLSILLAASISQAKTLTVVEVDTGFDFDSKWDDAGMVKPKLCKQGHKDFTNTGIKDVHGHGTHIAGLIGKYAKDADYCIVIAKFYNEKNDKMNMKNSIEALQYAINIKADVINLSMGGESRSQDECNLVKKALDKGIIIVAAAGNEGKDLNKTKYYPASCDERVIAVANIDFKQRKIASTSNYNEETIGVQGTDIKSILPNNKVGLLTGTSQATAIYTGKLIKTLNLLNNRSKK